MSATLRLSRLARALRGLPRWVWVAGPLLVGVAVAVALWAPWRRPAPADPSAPMDDPRLTFPTPFRNVRPEVRYVGDARCVECHVQGATFPKHPMGRSLAPVAAVAGQNRYDQAVQSPFEKFGFLFRAERRGQQVVHTATRRSADGKELYGITKEVAFAIGSGTHGRSFLVNEDGYLFQSPITWFPEARRWALSPGYTATTLFDRPIKPGCLFCHCDEARPVAHTINRYHTPIFRAHAIGCERCHGPAELHLRARDAGEPVTRPDHTIVNPKRLPPALRDAVCEQCHLQGESRILRHGRETFDYRPGLPFHLFWSVFVRPAELAEGVKFVGHVEQMRASSCAQKSKGKLGCISCHDPHQLPEADKRIGYYRERCQRCHEEKPCVRPAPPANDKHHQDHRADNCMACHMPRRDNTDIVHTTVVDHRVLRRQGAKRRPAQPQPGQLPLVHFHKGADGAEGAEDRDLGLAMIETAQQQSLPPWAWVAVGRLAQPLLDEAVRRAPDDVVAREGRGLTRAMQGDGKGALADFEAVLARVPQREVSLVAAGDMATALKRPEAAQDYWQRALAANPWTGRSHARFAELLAQRGQWSAAVKECRTALRLSPARDVRQLLITCLLRAGDRSGAEAELRVLLADRPGEERRLRDWWAGQAR